MLIEILEMKVIWPIDEKMRLEMVIEMQNGILNSQGYSFISNKPFEKRPGMIIQNLEIYFD